MKFFLRQLKINTSKSFKQLNNIPVYSEPDAEFTVRQGKTFTNSKRDELHNIVEKFDSEGFNPQLYGTKRS